MQSGHKRRVVGILACVILAGASIWEIRTASASKVTARAPKATRVQEPSQGAKIALKVSGPDAESSARDANLFSDSLESIGNAQALTFDGDGNSMVAVYSGGANDQIQVRQRTSTGDLSPAIITNLPTQGARSFVTGHFSGGSDRDLAIGTSQGQVVLMYGRSDGTFSEGPRIQLGGSISKLATADFARTGFEDIVAVDQANRKIYRLSGPVGLGDNTNPPALDLRGLRGEIVDVLAADFDGNHLPGLAVLTTEMVAVIHQRSEGIFSRPQVIGTGHFVAMTAGNFSHDRHPGLAVASDRDVTVFRTSRNRGFGPGVSFPAGNGLVDIKSGVFRHDRNPEASSDIVVADGAGQVSVFVHDGSGFRPSVTTEWDQPLSSIAIGPMQHGLNTIAVGVKSGIAVSVVTGGTITVSTITDENDCPSCDVAGLLAIKGVNQSPGGGNGVSLREAIIAVNNDNVLHGSTNWTISFAGITHAVPGSSTAGFTQSFRNNCTQGPADFFWEVFNGGGFGDLPFINSPGTVIDGNLVDHSVNGVNNTKGPFVFVSGNNSKRLFLITSSAPGCTIQNLGIIQGVGDAVSVASPNDTIANNIIGLGCDSISPIELAIHNNNTGAGIDFLSGSVNETVTGNVIANNNNNGILVNGVSQSVSTPQNNTISGNIIGLSKNAQAGVVDPGVGTGNNPTGNTGDGILLENGAVGNTIQNNTIGGNTIFGIEVTGDITSDAIIQGNKIGTDPSGITGTDAKGNPLGNASHGIAIGTGPGSSLANPTSTKFHTVSGNLLSGNLGFGLVVSNSTASAAQFNVVTNNRMGVNVTGSVDIPNALGGMEFTGSASNNILGGNSTGLGNQISGNGSGTAGPGVTVDGNSNNNIIQNNSIGPNNIGAGGGPPTDLTQVRQTSNKGGGVLVSSAAFANTVITNVIAFNNDGATASGIANTSTGNFNKFTQNQVFLNPPDVAPTHPQISDTAGQQGQTNAEVTLNPPNVTSLIAVTKATTITTTGDTVINGTANFLNNAVTANINNGVVEIFVSQRGSTTVQAQSEGQVFIGNTTSFLVDPNNPNTVDWSAHLTIPAPFLQPVQTPTLFLTATITSGDGSTSPLSFGLIPNFVGGTTGGCQITPSASVLNFTNITIGQTSTQNLILTNTSTGSVNVTISAITLNQTGSKFALGTIVPATTVGVSGTLSPTITLSPTGTATIPVKFSPTDGTSSVATLVISTSCGGAITIPINGNGSSSKIAVLPTTVNFGNVGTGTTATQQITVINFGTGALSVTGLTISGAPTSAFSVPANPAPFTVAAQSISTINVAFSPTASGLQTDTLVVASNDPVQPSVNVHLTGTGTDTIPPTVTVSFPQFGQVVQAGQTFQVIFSASDDVSVAGYTIKLSLDGGVTFPSIIGAGTAATGINTANALAPSTASTSAVVEVLVSDPAGNVGTGKSAVFTIGTPITVTSATFKHKRLIGTGANIQQGATLTVLGETFPLLVSADGTTFVVTQPARSTPSNLRIRSVGIVVGSTTAVIHNPGGGTSAPFTVN